MVNEPPSPEGKTTRFVSQHLPRTCNFFQGNKSSLQKAAYRTMEFYILQLVGLVKLSCNIDIKIVPSLAYTLFQSVNQLGN